MPSSRAPFAHAEPSAARPTRACRPARHPCKSDIHPESSAREAPGRVGIVCDGMARMRVVTLSPGVMSGRSPIALASRELFGAYGTGLFSGLISAGSAAPGARRIWRVLGAAQRSAAQRSTAQRSAVSDFFMRPFVGELLVVVEDLEYTPGGAPLPGPARPGPMAVDRETSCPSARNCTSAHKEVGKSACMRGEPRQLDGDCRFGRGPDPRGGRQSGRATDPGNGSRNRW